MEITFWGATEEVTGSMTFVHLPKGIICIDAGLYQGTQQTELLNEIPLPINPKYLKAIIITHAHLDHSGYLPILIKNGFRGKIFCTKPTAALMKIILEDSAKIPDQLFYETPDVNETIKHISIVNWNENKSLLGADFKLIPAGHILGASSIEIISKGKKVIFSGDLGRSDDPLMFPPQSCPKCDAVIMESTYGSRRRNGSIEKDLLNFLTRVKNESKVGIIASFAVARGQTLITLINEMFQLHSELKTRIVADSPMMNLANGVYQKFSHETKFTKLLKESLKNVDMIDHEGEWVSLKKKKGPLIILSSSGMLSGGRILRHIENWKDNENAILFLPGYQGAGTPGRDFVEGKREMKGLSGKNIIWKGEVMTSEAFSSHADREELISWLKNLNKGTKIFLIHGENESKMKLKSELEKSFTFVNSPKKNQTVYLD